MGFGNCDGASGSPIFRISNCDGASGFETIATDRLESAGVSDWLGVFHLNEWPLLLGWLVFRGGGRASLDAALGAKLGIAPPER